MKNRILTLLAVAFLGTVAFGQNMSMTSPDFGPNNPITCADYQNGSAQVFFDNGGSGGNYTANAADTFTVCPDIAFQTTWPKINAVFGTNQGFTFGIHPSDTLYIFDGPNTNAPLLAAINSGTNPNGGSFTASLLNNPSGCLTFVFHSDATNQGTGFAAGITCGNPPQPFYPHIEAFVNGESVNVMNPLDTGYVDVCLYDTILLVAKPTFPYSLENAGVGYSQTLTNINYNWVISGNAMGVNNDSILFIPQTRNGFFVRLKMTDIFPQTVQTFCKIRVSQLPSFAGTGPLLDVICINEQTELVGGATPTDTVGVAFPPGTFELGGVVAGLTYLPDGSGANYTTTITMGDFATGALFTGAADLQEVCITMEHSFLGDLEMWLTCPNGTEVTLFNANTGGYLPGGFGGGGTYLGGANDGGNGTPGVGSQYCFSSTNNTWGTFPTENAAGNFVQAGTPQGSSMNPNGVYLPEESFNAFVGCPLNGAWTITVRDNWAIDDGYIFEWGLNFNPSLFPNNETYYNSISNEYWENDPSIISGLNDTLIVVQPFGPGVHNYTYVVEDNFGCFYDTTVSITVKQPIILNLPDSICTLTYTSTLSTGTNDGQWSFYGSTGTPTFQADNVNTTFTFPGPGVYHLVYSDTSCTDKDTAHITIVPLPPFDFDSDFFNCPFETEHMVFKDSAQIEEFHWGLVIPALDTLFEADLFQGTYTASYVTKLGCTRDTTFTISTQPETNLFNYPDICGDTIGLVLNVGYPTGTWATISQPGSTPPVFSSPGTLQTSVTVTDFGSYTFIFTESGCQDTDTVDIVFTPYPWFSVQDGVTCIGDQHTFTAFDNGYAYSYSWNNGTVGPSTTVTDQGNYILTGTNQCGTYSDTAFLTTEVCVIEFPNVFTPNADGPNDTWHALNQPDGFATFKCQIFNRWGNLMYEYDNVAGSWDGKNSSGNMASEGVYFYTVVANTKNGKEITRQGFFHLIVK